MFHWAKFSLWIPLTLRINTSSLTSLNHQLNILVLMLFSLCFSLKSFLFLHFPTLWTQLYSKPINWVIMIIVVRVLTVTQIKFFHTLVCSTLMVFRWWHLFFISWRNDHYLCRLISLGIYDFDVFPSIVISLGNFTARFSRFALQRRGIVIFTLSLVVWLLDNLLRLNIWELIFARLAPLIFAFSLSQINLMSSCVSL